MHNKYEHPIGPDSLEQTLSASESKEGLHNPIEKWLSGEVNDIDPVRVDAVPVAECNLNCKHCLWPHYTTNEQGERVPMRSPDDGSHWENQVETIKEMGVPVVYAGRIINERGEHFIQACIDKEVPIDIIDNGYTILAHKYERFLPYYSSISISLDGAESAHDEQRNKKGSFRKAWNSILQLKKMGYDPVVSTAFSPISVNGWDEFEDMLRDPEAHDDLSGDSAEGLSSAEAHPQELCPIPVSVALTVSYPETVKRNEGAERPAMYEGEDKEALLKEGFDILLSGIPKLIHIYDLDTARVLKDRLREFDWKPGDSGDCLVAETPNGSIVEYHPDSVTSTSNLVLKWDGEFYLPWGKEFLKKDDFDPSIHGREINSRNVEELNVWREILQK